MNAPLRRLVPLGVSWLVLLAIALRLAWLGDDAYITLRAVENWVAGNGLRWNVLDRVQINTHPLWMLVLAGGRWLTGEVYFTTIVISLGVAMVAIGLLLQRVSTAAALVAVATVLASTRAFVEYTTSGLETPLTYLLLVLFAGVVLRAPADSTPPGERLLGRVTLLAALLALNRMDVALLCAPAVVAALRGVRLGTACKCMVVASAPLWSWLLFATIYYGSPFPVIAHAKVFAVGIGAGELAVQGLRYAAFALGDDPVLLPAIALGLTIGLWHRPTRWLAFGAWLYCGYVIKVGGDFMAGRFFLPPFVVAVTMLGSWLARRSLRSAVVVSVAALGLLATRGVPPWLRSPASDVDAAAATKAAIEVQHGIGDERLVYYGQLGLWAKTRTIPVFGALQAMARPDGSSARWILLNGAVGSAGFGAGARGHIVDPLLCDPLIARLPARDPARWRIGHVLRRIPEGYWETLATGDNRIHHPGLRDWYGALRTLTQAPVFASERRAAGWRWLTGEYDAGFRGFLAEQYYQPPRLPIAAAELAVELPLGSFWFDEPRVRIVYDGGVAIGFVPPRTASSLRLQVLGTHFFQYRCRFVRNGEVRGEAIAAPLPPPAGLSPLQLVAGLQEQLVMVPPGTGSFDSLWVDFVDTPQAHTATGPAAIGAVLLAP